MSLEGTFLQDTLDWLDENMTEVEVPELESGVQRAPAPTFHLPNGLLIVMRKQKFRTLPELKEYLRGSVALGLTVYLGRVMHVPPRTMVVDGQSLTAAGWFVAESACMMISSGAAV